MEQILTKEQLQALLEEHSVHEISNMLGMTEGKIYKPTPGRKLQGIMVLVTTSSGFGK